MCGFWHVVVCSEELDRPENRDLKPLVEKLGRARDAIIAQQRPGQDPLSWADTIVLAAKVSRFGTEGDKAMLVQG
jgi:hypothetical protein